jgi:hypothetical protein
MFKGVVADHVENQTKIGLRCFTQNCFTMIFSPRPVFYVVSFLEVYKMHTCLLFCDCTILFVRLLWAENKLHRCYWFIFLTKTTIAMRMLSLGTPTKAQEEYCRMAPSTAWESMLRWCRGVRRCFEYKYLRQPTREDIITQMTVNHDNGWPGMFGSIWLHAPEIETMFCCFAMVLSRQK